MNLEHYDWSFSIRDEVGFCARRFGTNYGIFGSSEQECRDRMVEHLGKQWKWLRLLGWSVGTYTVPRHIWTATPKLAPSPAQ
jgi:hypothetical protein